MYEVNNKELNESNLLNLKKFQMKIRYDLEYIKSFNSDYNLVNDRIKNVLNMTLTNYQMNIISHERYNLRRHL